VRTKLSLSKTERQEYNVNANRLMAAGVIPREDKPASEPQMLTVEQVGGPLDSFVHALSLGGYGIGVWVRIVVLKSGIRLSDCQVNPRKWDDTRIRLVDETNRLYSYARTVGVEYPRADVLNPWISNNQYLRRGEVLEGVVMAYSPVPLPAWCVNGISIEAELCFVDQFDNIYPLNVDLRVIRDQERSVRPRRSTEFQQALHAANHGAGVEKPDPSGRDDISRKEPSVPRPEGGVH
jgi:hypothetical protein